MAATRINGAAARGVIMRALLETFMRSAFVMPCPVLPPSPPFLCAASRRPGESNGVTSRTISKPAPRPGRKSKRNCRVRPSRANLIEVKLDSTTRNSLFIDAASLSVGDDGVVRYTAVIRTPSGAENVSFEGLRCEAGERKLYAFGRTSGAEAGTWSRNRYARWEPIQARLAGGYHRELFFHYLCTVATKRDVPTLLRLLKSGGIYAQ
jgi:hypothetical protein